MDFANLMGQLTDTVNSAVTVLISLAILLFFYHTGKGIFGNASSGGTAKTDLKQTLLWGVIIIFVMVSIGGILSFITDSIGIMDNTFTN